MCMHVYIILGVSYAVCIYIYIILCRVNLKTQYVFAYMTYGVNCTEVEIDVLTGEVEVLRTDILFDCGQRCGLY